MVFSVLEVIKLCEHLVGFPISYKVEARRDGDPSILVADSCKAIKLLEWNAEFCSLVEILSSSLLWHRNQSDILRGG